MARTARLVIPELSVHIVQRGHDGGDCFFERTDYLFYLSLLREFAPRCACSIHAYCLMTNHVHLFITPHAADSCAQLMKNVGQRYVQRVNARRSRSGTLWEGRFYSCLVPTERYAVACYRYVECNPVKPGIALKAADYPWSSHAVNAGTACDPLVTPHPAYIALAQDQARRVDVYKALCEEPLPRPLAEDLRRATRRGQAAGTPARARGRPWRAR
jgi:putative transposase